MKLPNPNIRIRRPSVVLDSWKSYYEADKELESALEIACDKMWEKDIKDVQFPSKRMPPNWGFGDSGVLNSCRNGIDKFRQRYQDSSKDFVIDPEEEGSTGRRSFEFDAPSALPKEQDSVDGDKKESTSTETQLIDGNPPAVDQKRRVRFPPLKNLGNKIKGQSGTRKDAISGKLEVVGSLTDKTGTADRKQSGNPVLQRVKSLGPGGDAKKKTTTATDQSGQDVEVDQGKKGPPPSTDRIWKQCSTTASDLFICLSEFMKDDIETTRSLSLPKNDVQPATNANAKVHSFVV